MLCMWLHVHELMPSGRYTLRWLHVQELTPSAHNTLHVATHESFNTQGP